MSYYFMIKSSPDRRTTSQRKPKATKNRQTRSPWTSNSFRRSQKRKNKSSRRLMKPHMSSLWQSHCRKTGRTTSPAMNPLLQIRTCLLSPVETPLRNLNNRKEQATFRLSEFQTCKIFTTVSKTLRTTPVPYRTIHPLRFTQGKVLIYQRDSRIFQAQPRTMKTKSSN